MIVTTAKIKLGAAFLIGFLMMFLAGCSTCEEPNSCNCDGGHWWSRSNCNSDVSNCPNECTPVRPGCGGNYDSRPTLSAEEAQRLEYVNELQRVGVGLVEIGDNVTFILPADRFFDGKTAVLDPRYFYNLNQIAMYICCVEKIDVKVAGYTDCTGNSIRDLALSRAQAQAIAHYLWQRGIDTRLMYVAAYGNQMPVANNCTCQGQSMNRRVEITLRRITDNFDY